MSAEFVALAELVRLRAAPPGAPVQPAAAESGPPDEAQSTPLDAFEAAPEEIAEALRDARLFRARLADAFDAALARLLAELASSVLARELRLAPCELGALVQRAAAGAPIVRVRVALEANVALRGVEIVRDPALGEGDALVELAGGAIDARLGVRLALALEAFA